jgi:hypothetical protein
MSTLHVRRTALFAVAILVFPLAVGASTVLFDNGSFSGPQELRNASGPHTVLEDFRIDLNATITRVEWTQHDSVGEPYNFTIISLYSEFPSNDNLITQFQVVANRTPNNTGVILNHIGFDYSVSGLSIFLPRGTYWIGLRSEFPGGGGTWDMTTGTPSTIPGRYQQSERINELPGRFRPTEDSAFRIIGTFVIPIELDIKPGSDANSINPRSRGFIPVAILTTETFDASTIDPSTLRFGPDGAAVADMGAHFEDVDLDGDADLVAHFRTQETGIACGDTEATLTGETTGGQPIEGSDSINTVGCT